MEETIYVLWYMPPEPSPTGSGEWIPVMRQVELPLSVADAAVRAGRAYPAKFDFQWGES
jgi:hypothetical protein